MIKIPPHIIEESLGTIYAELDTSHSEEILHGERFFRYRKNRELASALASLKNLRLFQDVEIGMEEQVLTDRLMSKGRFDLNEFSHLTNAIAEIKKRTKDLLNVVKILVPVDTPDSIFVKLPPIVDFEELSKVSKELQIAISGAIFYPEVDGTIVIQGVENGSIWFNVRVGSIALGLIASLTWSAAVINKKMKEADMIEAQVRALELKNESIADLVEVQKKQVDLLIISEAQHLNGDYFDDNDPERIERLKHSVELLAGIIYKGGEIQPALAASEDVKNLFPDFKMLPFIESKTKMIEEKKD